MQNESYKLRFDDLPVDAVFQFCDTPNAKRAIKTSPRKYRREGSAHEIRVGALSSLVIELKND